MWSLVKIGSVFYKLSRKMYGSLVLDIGYLKIGHTPCWLVRHNLVDVLNSDTACSVRVDEQPMLKVVKSMTPILCSEKLSTVWVYSTEWFWLAPVMQPDTVSCISDTFAPCVMMWDHSPKVKTKGGRKGYFELPLFIIILPLKSCKVW